MNQESLGRVKILNIKTLKTPNTEKFIKRRKLKKDRKEDQNISQLTTWIHSKKVNKNKNGKKRGL